VTPHSRVGMIPTSQFEAPGRIAFHRKLAA
jgi:hypothetical protein